MERSRTFNPTAGFSPDVISAGLSRLYTVDGGRLVSNVDCRRKPPACPITLAPFEDPVLLEDGFVYEHAAIAQWLQGNSNSPCTNMEVRNLRLLRLEPLRAVVNKFLQRDGAFIEKGWRDLLSKVEDVAKRSSSPLPIRCVQVDQAIASCMAENSQLEAGLDAAISTANELRVELRSGQENGSVKLQRAIRRWLARRHLRRLVGSPAWSLVKSMVQVHIARQFLERLKFLGQLRAALRIQRWWKKFKTSVKQTKSQRRRRSKKEREKALRNAEKPEPPSSVICYWNQTTGERSWDPPSASNSKQLIIPVELIDTSRWPPCHAAAVAEHVRGWDAFIDEFCRLVCFNSRTRAMIWGLPTSSTPEEGWKKSEDDQGRVFWWNKSTRRATWFPPAPESEEFAAMVPPMQDRAALVILYKMFPTLSFAEPRRVDDMMALLAKTV